MIAVSLLLGSLSLAYVVSSTPLRGVARWLAPDTTATIMLYLIFVVRPLFANRFLEHTINGYLPTPASTEVAMLAGAMGITSLAIGCFFATARGRRLKELRASSVPAASGRRVPSLHVLMVAIAATLVYLALILLLSGPSVVSALAGGRSAEASLAGVPEVVMMIPLSGSIAAALFLVSRRGSAIAVREHAMVFCAVAISVLSLSQLGSRRFLIPALLIPLIAALMRRPVRLRMWHLGAAFLALIFFAIVPMVRSAGARLPGETLMTASLRYLQEEGIEGVLMPVFASYDTEMLDYIGVVRDYLENGDSVGYGMGRGTLIEFLTRPIPGVEAGYSDVLLTSLYGGGCGQPACPVASIVGVLYFDGGLVAVVIGSVVAGLVLRWLATRWAFHSGLSIVHAVGIAIPCAFALIAVRTNTIHALWWIIYAELILWLIGLVLVRPFGRREGDSAKTAITNPNAGVRAMIGDRRHSSRAKTAGSGPARHQNWLFESRIAFHW